jgi:hypothetical protein
MWEWVLQTAKSAAKAALKADENKGGLVKVRYICDVDDIASEVCCMLMSMENQDYIKRAYESKNTSIIYGVAKRVIFKIKAEQMFKHRRDYHEYCTLRKICEEYGIEPIPENAYKIQEILEGVYHKKLNSGSNGLSGNGTSAIVFYFETMKPLIHSVAWCNEEVMIGEERSESE